jgi:hypothetical protein
MSKSADRAAERKASKEGARDFCALLAQWLGMGIATVTELADESGYCRESIKRYCRLIVLPKQRIVDDLLQAMGVVERKYIEQWSSGK